MNKNDDFKFKKSLGQNFLSDTNLLKALLRLVPVTKNTNVLEIGLGKGSLTSLLIKQVKKVVGYEIDKQLAPFLQSRFEGESNFTLVLEDGLKADIKQIEAHFKGESFAVVANLPYYITSPLIFKFLEQTDKLEFLAVMVQKEVAERIVAQPNTPNYGALSVICQHHGLCSIKKIVSRKMFFPVPKVDSAFVLIEKNKSFDFQFSALVRASFAMRRKTLINNLTTHYKVDKNKLYPVLDSLNLPHAVRAESLSPQQFFLLLQQIKTIISN